VKKGCSRDGLPAAAAPARLKNTAPSLPPISYFSSLQFACLAMRRPSAARYCHPQPAPRARDQQLREWRRGSDSGSTRYAEEIQKSTVATYTKLKFDLTKAITGFGSDALLMV